MIKKMIQEKFKGKVSKNYIMFYEENQNIL